MSYNNYLLNLANISNEIGYSLTYGYGDIAVTEINSLKALIAKSEEMIPILEAEACFNEAEELDREEKSFNYWMTMLYGNGNDFTPVEAHNSEKANRLKRRKQNIRHHKTDRKHGKTVPQSDKKYWDEQSGTWYRWDEKKKTFHSHKKPVVHRKRKTFRDRLNSAMEEREKDLLAFDDLYDKSELVVKQARKETDPIRKTQLWDLDRNLTDAMCVDFYDGWYPDLSMTPERF